jgi:serine/threonine protein kinase
MKQLAAGVRQMHKYHIIHMNLHPQNVQLTGSDTVKISNFSNSRCLGDTAETKNYDVKNIKLTELLAPELL